VSEGLRRLIEERLRARDEVIREAKRLALRLREALGQVSLLLYGSYARGDFNLWSDIDVIVVSEAFKGVNPLRRYDMIAAYIPPGFEVKCLTPDEAARYLSKPWGREILREGIVIEDGYGVFS